MAGKKIKGITIEIGGNTQPLEKALGDVNKKTRDLQGELKSVERLLKLDPKNTELLAQKQKLLAEAVDNSREKLNRLKQAQEEVNRAFQRGDIGEEQYRHFSRQVINAEQDLNRFENQLRDIDKVAQRTSRDLEKMGRSVEDVGNKLSMGVTLPVVGGVVGVTEGTRDFRGDLARLKTNAKEANQEIDVLNEGMAKMYAITGEVDSNVEGFSNLLAAGFRDKSILQIMEGLAGASIKWSDTLKFEGLADGLQETLATGKSIGMFDELLSRSGVNLDEWNAGLQTAIESGTQQEYVLETLAKTGLAGVYEEYRKTNKELTDAAEANYKMQEALADLATTLDPIVTKVITFITRMVESFNSLSPASQDVILVVMGIVAALGPLLVIVGKAMVFFKLFGVKLGAVTGIGTKLMGFISKLGPLIAGLSGPVGWVVLGIAALIAILATLWNTSGDFRNWIRELGQGFEYYLKDKINGFIDDINWLITKFNQLSGKEVNLISKLTKTSGTSGFADFKQLPGNAGGTDFWRGGLTWVGERGAELINLPRGSQVFNNRQSMAMMKNQTINHTGEITVRGVNDRNQLIGITKIIAEEFDRESSRMPTQVSTIPFQY